MSVSKGFTLVEIIVALFIVGILAAITIPSYVASMEQTNAQAAKNNLMSISAAEQKYYEDHGIYYTGGNLMATLSLTTATNDAFTYSCTVTAQTIPYNCTASDGTVTILFDPNTSPNNCPATQQPVCCTAGPVGDCPS